MQKPREGKKKPLGRGTSERGPSSHGTRGERETLFVLGERYGGESEMGMVEEREKRDASGIEEMQNGEEEEERRRRKGDGGAAAKGDRMKREGRRIG